MAQGGPRRGTGSRSRAFELRQMASEKRELRKHVETHPYENNYGQTAFCRHTSAIFFK